MCTCCGIEDAALNELHAIQERLDVLLTPGGQVVEHHDLLAQRRQMFN